ncbi:MAG: TerY-C metal binding domain-containing protein [Phycisphaeraceae bacterium]
MAYYRRLPIYLLIDTSESMAGEPFDAVQAGLASMMGELRSNPMAMETAVISLITFASQAQQAVPLMDVLKFQIPRLKMGSGTAMGSALTILMDSMSKEVITTTPTQKGDFKPIVFLMTDGTPTDKWEKQADTVKNTITGKRANVIAVACGSDADVSMLGRITSTIVRLKGMEGGNFKQFFKWVSASVSSASQKLNQSADAPVGLPDMPREMEVANPAEQGEAPEADRFVFLHAKCSKSRQFYICRYVKAGMEKAGMFKKRAVYQPVGNHRVDDFDFGDGKGSAMSVPVESLHGILPCPYCSGPGMAICEQCNKLSCVYNNNPTCGWCGFSGALGSAAGGSVGRGRG